MHRAGEMPDAKRLLRAIVRAFAFSAWPWAAYAGGTDIPDQGAEALGRGGAFVAKADNGTAILYNPAGLARQRGTRLHLGGNLFLHSFEFQRAGTFPDEANDAATPWGGKPFPRIKSVGGLSFVPFASLSSDFGTFDRLTLAIGVFGPPSIGNRTFPLTEAGAPAASRYDLIQSRSSVFLPTASAAYRLTRGLDLGVSMHAAFAQFAETRVSYSDIGDACRNAEYQPCDAPSSLAANATSFGATVGALARPTPNLAVGVSVRTPIHLEGEGTVTPAPSRNSAVQVLPGTATMSTDLPLIVRAGGRYIAMNEDVEVYDLELDATFEGWSAQGDGPRVRIPSLGDFKDIDRNVTHGYKNTFSVRGGGAYHFDTLDGVFTLRAGSYFDSSATSYEYTRVDVDTLTKIAGTIGFGYRRGGVAIDLGYAAVASLPRGVGDGKGEVRPFNDAKNGRSVDSQDRVLPAVNEGEYRGFTHVFALGMTLAFDAFFESSRRISYRNDYERTSISR